MQLVRAWHRRPAPRRATSGLRRWLVPLLALAFAVSGLVHALDGGQAASHLHEQASLSQDAGGEPCCPEHDGQPHGTVCGMTSGCSLGVPAISSAVLAISGAEPAEIQPEAVLVGRVLSPRTRPPKLSPNV